MLAEPQERFLVVGLGNLLLRDDGVGVHVVRALAEAPPPDTLVVEVGTAVLDALHLFEAAERILAIDAMKAGGPPGTVYRCGIDAVADTAPVSLHELDIRAAVRMMGSGREPNLQVIGVEPMEIDYGMELSEPVAHVVPGVMELVRRTIGAWAMEPGSADEMAVSV